MLLRTEEFSLKFVVCFICATQKFMNRKAYMHYEKNIFHGSSGA